MRRPDVAELMEEIDSEQFAEWQAYSAADPFLDERMDLLFASVLAHFTNMFSGEASTNPASVSDFHCNPWCAENFRPPAETKAKVCQTLKSIFSGMRGVRVISPEEKK